MHVQPTILPEMIGVVAVHPRGLNRIIEFETIFKPPLMQDMLHVFHMHARLPASSVSP